jgi:hypothetical protein
MKYKLLLSIAFLSLTFNAGFSKDIVYNVKSPDNKIAVRIEAGKDLKWSVNLGSKKIILPSALAVELASGEVLGKNVQVISSKLDKINSSFATPL